MRRHFSFFSFLDNFSSLGKISQNFSHFLESHKQKKLVRKASSKSFVDLIIQYCGNDITRKSRIVCNHYLILCHSSYASLLAETIVYPVILFFFQVVFLSLTEWPNLDFRVFHLLTLFSSLASGRGRWETLGMWLELPLILPTWKICPGMPWWN